MLIGKYEVYMGATPFSERDNTVRKTLHISQIELARDPGVSFATDNRRERWETRPPKLAQKQSELFCLEKKSQSEIHG